MAEIYVEFEQNAVDLDVRVTPSIPGPPGPPGPPGDPDELGLIVALTPAGQSWTVDHDLPFRPSVTVTDSSGNVVECNVRHVSSTQIQITTDATFSGEASLT